MKRRIDNPKRPYDHRFCFNDVQMLYYTTKHTDFQDHYSELFMHLNKVAGGIQKIDENYIFEVLFGTIQYREERYSLLHEPKVKDDVHAHERRR